MQNADHKTIQRKILGSNLKNSILVVGFLKFAINEVTFNLKFHPNFKKKIHEAIRNCNTPHTFAFFLILFTVENLSECKKCY